VLIATPKEDDFKSKSNCSSLSPKPAHSEHKNSAQIKNKKKPGLLPHIQQGGIENLVQD
jgi:hypothetical protein